MTLLAINFAPIEVANGVAAGALCGTILTPDADLRNSLSKSMLGVLGIRWAFAPYTNMTGHRSRWSHAPFISTFLRGSYVAVLLLPFFMLAWALGYDVPLFVFRNFWFGVIVAWVMQDLSHLLLDGILFKKWS